jgi:hypothetical protein
MALITVRAVSRGQVTVVDDLKFIEGVVMSLLDFTRMFMGIIAGFSDMVPKIRSNGPAGMPQPPRLEQQPSTNYPALPATR